ncbi:MAG: hypothetical protein IIC36_11850 [Gemmatimonadetes bacterium]|nr:hypothetical protein [Gemmatimonadota bacterium]
MSPAPARVARIVEGVRAHLLGRVRMALGLWVGAALAGALALAWLAVAPEGWRQGTSAPLLIDMLVVGTLVSAWLVHRRLTESWLREPNVARNIEREVGMAPGVLRGSLELARALPPGVSRGLADRAAQDALGRLQAGQRSLAGRMTHEVGRWMRRGGLGLGLLMPLVVVLTVVAPGRSLMAWAGLARPFELMAGPTLPALVVTPGTVEVRRGSDVPMQVSAPGRTTVTVHWQAAGDVALEELIELDGDRGSFVLRSVTARTEYWVQAPDGAMSPRYTLQPVDPLLVGDLTVRISFPPHTGRSPEEYGVVVPPLQIPIGSVFSFEGQASRPLLSAGLERLEAEVEGVAEAGVQSEAGVEPETGVESEAGVAFTLNGRGFEGRWTPRVSGVYEWRFTGVDGEPAEILPPPLGLTVVPDSAPHISVLFPGRDTLLPASLRQPLVLEATDDYGLDHLTLVVYRVTAFGDRLTPVEQPIPVGGTRGALLRPVIDLTSWELLPGDTIRYFARAVDNAPIPNVSETREYVLRTPTAADLRREAQERLDEAARGVERLANQAEARAAETRELENELSNQRNPESQSRREESEERLAFDQQEDVREALEAQEELLAALDSLEMEMAELNRDLEATGLADPELQAEIRELQRLLNELAPESLEERLAELAERLDQMTAEDANEALRELAADQEALRDRLEAAIEEFERAAMEQDFRATAAEAEELAQQEQALADAMKEGDSPDLRAEQQEALEARAQDLDESLDDLQQRLAEAGEEQAREAVEQAQTQGQQAQQSMSEAAQQARSGEPQEASEAAQRAADAMSRMSQQLQQGEQQMAAQNEAASREALERAATDALSLAREQTALQDRMRGAGPEDLANMRSDEAALLQGVRNMAEALSGEMSADQGSNEVAAQMGQAMEAIRETLDALESQRGDRPSPSTAAEQAVAALNEAAMMAASAAKAPGRGPQGQAGDEVTEELQQIARQQGSVNQRTGQITPMKLGQQARANQLRAAAESQEKIARQLSELAQRPPDRAQALGDLDALAREAQALAERLARETLDAETLQRQERLFHRLLDAGRSLEKDEYSDERESSAPGQFERNAVELLSAEDLGALRFQLPPSEELQRLSPAQRQMVLEYFERLNRAERRAAPRGTIR